MKHVKSATREENIPYFSDLQSFYKHINARPPLHKDFDIREIDPEILNGYDFVTKPFRHSFYCIALFLQGDLTIDTGFWKTRLKQPSLFFSTPFQILSWTKPERWLKEYFIVFTEDFLVSYKPIADIIFAFPFFRLQKLIPFELESDKTGLLADLYSRVLKEYRSENPDKFDLIASYVHTLLIHVRRIYNKYVGIDKTLTVCMQTHDNLLVEEFRLLIKKKILSGPEKNRNRSVKYFASQLAIHPNHLNAIVKRRTKKTAIRFIHEQLVHEAKALLNQTSLNIKEISFILGFNEPAHFNHFFKRQTSTTPVLYRKEKFTELP